MAGAGSGKTSFQDRYGPWAVVAGASEGLGAEFAAQLAAYGLNLALVARRGEKLAALAGQLTARYQVQARSLPLDLAGEETPAEILAATRDLEVGLLVYNASFSAIGPFWEHPLEDHHRELQVNCRAPLALAYAFGQLMLSRGRGGILLMSSLSASQGSAFISNYAATKAYNLILAEGLWEELGERGVDVLACCPSATRTPNYLASLSHHSGNGPGAAMEPGAVVMEALAALGRQPSLIPGRLNRWMGFAMRRVLPRRAAIRLMGRVLRGMYVHLD